MNTTITDDKRRTAPMNDITPGQVYRETGRWFGPMLVLGLAILAIGLVLTLVGWRAGW